MFTSDIEDCAGLHAWLQEEGAGLDCGTRNKAFVFRIRYVPSAVRYCMAPLDAFGESGRSAASVISQGMFTTQFILEIQPLAGAMLDASQPLRFVETDIVEILGTDTMPCAFLHHEPRIPSLPYQRLILGFDHPESSMDRKIVLRDRDGTHGGDVILRFDQGVFQVFEMLNVDSTLTLWGA